MTIYESAVTAGNLRHGHIYITPLRRHLPSDVFGGTDRHGPAARLVRLQFGGLSTDTFVTTDKKGRPRNFFQDRAFAAEVLARTGANVGDVVLFQEVSPYHFQLSLRRAGGGLVKA